MSPPRVRVRLSRYWALSYLKKIREDCTNDPGPAVVRAVLPAAEHVYPGLPAVVPALDEQRWPVIAVEVFALEVGLLGVDEFHWLYCPCGSFHNPEPRSRNDH